MVGVGKGGSGAGCGGVGSGGSSACARSALVATRRLAEGASDAGFYRAKVLTARFYAEQVLPQAAGHLRAVEAGATTLALLFTGIYRWGVRGLL